MIWCTHWPKQELYKAGRYAEAVSKAQRVLEIREKMLGPDHPNIATLPGAVGSSPRWKAGRNSAAHRSTRLRASRCEAPDRARSPLRTRSPLFVVPRPSASSVSLSEFSSCSREGQPFPKGPRQTLEGGGAGRPRQRAGFGGESGREMLGASSPAVLPLPADCGIPGVRRAITGANLSIDGGWTEA